MMISATLSSLPRVSVTTKTAGHVPQVRTISQDRIKNYHSFQNCKGEVTGGFSSPQLQRYVGKNHK